MGYGAVGLIGAAALATAVLVGAGARSWADGALAVGSTGNVVRDGIAFGMVQRAQGHGGRDRSQAMPNFQGPCSRRTLQGCSDVQRRVLCRCLRSPARHARGRLGHRARPAHRQSQGDRHVRGDGGVGPERILPGGERRLRYHSAGSTRDSPAGRRQDRASGNGQTRPAQCCRICTTADRVASDAESRGAKPVQPESARVAASCRGNRRACVFS